MRLLQCFSAGKILKVIFGQHGSCSVEWKDDGECQIQEYGDCLLQGSVPVKGGRGHEILILPSPGFLNRGSARYRE
jgi:hypothetical protein